MPNCCSNYTSNTAFTTDRITSLSHQCMGKMKRIIYRPWFVCIRCSKQDALPSALVAIDRAPQRVNLSRVRHSRRRRERMRSAKCLTEDSKDRTCHRTRHTAASVTTLLPYSTCNRHPMFCRVNNQIILSWNVNVYFLDYFILLWYFNILYCCDFVFVCGRLLVSSNDRSYPFCLWCLDHVLLSLHCFNCCAMSKWINIIPYQYHITLMEKCLKQTKWSLASRDDHWNFTNGSQVKEVVNYVNYSTISFSTNLIC